VTGHGLCSGTKLPKITKTTKRFVIFVIFVIFAVFMVFVLEREPSAVTSQPVFRSGVDGVTITASVRRGNRPVAGLTAADFALTDNGVPQAITIISAGQVPLDLTLLLDLSSSVDGPLLQRLKTAVRDTAALLRDDDRIRLVTISQVLHEVFSLRPRADAMLRADARALDPLEAEGATSLYDGIAATMMRPTAPERRQLIVAFSDGQDSTSIIDEKTAREIARLTDAVVDIVVPVAGAREDAGSRRLSQRGGSLDSLSAGDNVTAPGNGAAGRADGHAEYLGIPRVLAELVGPTSGQVFPLETGDSVSRVFKATLDDFRASYGLQYVPQGVAAAGWHEVTVAVTRHPKYEIRARKGYEGRSKITQPEVIR
jgi:VWFA-related protein